MTAAAPLEDIAALKAMLARALAALAATEAVLAERTARLAEVEEARRRLELTSTICGAGSSARAPRS